MVCLASAILSFDVVYVYIGSTVINNYKQVTKQAILILKLPASYFPIHFLHPTEIYFVAGWKVIFLNHPLLSVQ